MKKSNRWTMFRQLESYRSVQHFVAQNNNSKMSGEFVAHIISDVVC